MSDVDAVFNKARANHQAGRIEQAITGYRKLLKRVPHHPHAHYLYGVALMQLNQGENAIIQFESMLRLRPAHVPTRLSMAKAYSDLGKIKESQRSYKQTLEYEPDNYEALCAIADFLEKEEDWEGVIEQLSERWERKADSLKLLGFLSRAYNQLFRYGKSADICLEYTELTSNSEENREKAINWLDTFFSKITHPDSSLIHRLANLNNVTGKKLYLMALILGKRDMLFEKSYKDFRQLDPKGVVLNDLTIIQHLHNNKLYKQAEHIGWKLLETSPDNEAYLHKLVDSLLGMATADHPEKYTEAKEIAQQFLKLHPDSVQANLAMGAVYMGASRPELAYPYQERALKYEPTNPIRGSMLFTVNYDENRDPEKIFGMHKEWGSWYEKDKTPLLHEFPNLKTSNRKLRIGYLSPDLGYHPVGYFFIDILKSHNPDNVEVFLFSNRNEIDGDDALSQEFRGHVGTKHWMWTREMSVDKVVSAIRDREIDILVEMAGHTAYNRLDVCAHRAAPIQVVWLGYPNTTGLSSIDYRFSDEITEPRGDADERSTEKIWRLPNGFHAIRMPVNLPPVSPPPCLKNGYITFGTYNNMNKLGSESIRLWADLLKRVPKSRIIIKHKTLKVLNNRQSLISRFAMHGIQAWRVDLRETTAGTYQHLESYGDIDIALDPLAYNGTTTSCDALIMGVPILTLPGRTHASRVTASLLHRMQMDRWVAENREDFLSIGAMAAQNFQYLKELRLQQRKRFIDSPLNDGLGMARDLEHAYRKMWAYYCESVEEVVL